MKIIKPQSLRQGDVIGIAAPASPPASEEHLARGIRYLERLGLQVELGKNLYKRRGYLAGTDKERIEDLHQLFSDRRVKAIFCARGGYGSSHILPKLDFRLIKRNPKIFVGYSDITALQLAIFAKTGLVTFSGPMVAVEMATAFNGEAEERFWRCLTSTSAIKTIRIPVEEKRIVFRGRAEGVLIGGNLSMVASLVGSGFFPNLRQSLLFFEEIGERPYRINRMLNQLRLAKVFDRCTGVALGLFRDCEPEQGKPSLTLTSVFTDSFEEYGIPVFGHLHYGHVDDLLTMPIGIRAVMASTTGTLRFLEPAVRL